MYDYGLSILEQYGQSAEETSRTRGALLCRTRDDLLILKEFHGSEKKMRKQQELLLMLESKGFHTDSYLENQEGNLVTEDKDHIPYTVQHWQKGRECDTRSREDLKRSVAYLAKLHKAMQMPFQKEYQQRSLLEEYEKHNQELRKIRRFIRKRGAGNAFEKLYVSSADVFLEKGEGALKQLQDSAYEKLRECAEKSGTICHGEYHQHNVWFTDEGIRATSFQHWNYDIQIADLYRFMRKILEKNNWDPVLAGTLFRMYHKEKEITREEWENLKIRFSYPEKFWKIADHYYSHKKTWISEKNMEKLGTVIRQRAAWENFIEKCFGEYPF